MYTEVEAKTAIPFNLLLRTLIDRGIGMGVGRVVGIWVGVMGNDHFSHIPIGRLLKGASV